MTESVESSRQMLRDANKMIYELNLEISRFFALKPYAQVIEHNAKTGLDTHKVKLTREIPGEFRSKTRHIASDLRSALDHLGYATAVANGHTNPRKTYFPFARSETELGGVIARRCKHIPTEIASVFESFKPYLGGDDILWSLNEIANCNKHRTIVPVGHAMGGGGLIENFLCDGAVADFSFPPRWDTEKNEVVLCVVESAAKTDYNLHITFTVAFGEIEAIARRPILDTLVIQAATVRSIIDAVEVEGNRIGLFSNQSKAPAFSSI